MAENTCTVTVMDYTGHREGESPDVRQLEAVNMELTVCELKELICGQKPDPTSTAATTVLYMGKAVMEDKKKLKMYNRSRRTHLTLDLRDLVQLKITVKTLQHCGKGNCVMVPLWAFCCQQHILVKVPDYETVGYLRREVANELGDPKGHPAAKLRLYANRELLTDDLQGLREVGIRDGSHITVFVHICFFRKRPAEGDQTTDGHTSSRSPAVSPSPHGAEGEASAAEALPQGQADDSHAAMDTAAPPAETGGEEAEHHDTAADAAAEPAQTTVAENHAEEPGQASSS